MAEYPYPKFKHGAYGKVIANGVKLARNGNSPQTFVYFGTAPVGQVEGAATKSVNKPIVCTGLNEFRKHFGYSDNWADYTLCEAAYVHFQQKGVGPVIFVNVLNPTTHKKGTASTASLTPKNGRITIASAEDICIDTITVTKGSGQDAEVLVKDTDYSVTFDTVKMAVILQELTAGVFGSSALAVEYYKMDASAVTSSAIIGTTDGYGLNTGLYTILDVYNLTGYIPAFIGAPGWSSIPAVHTAMAEVSLEIGKHWNAWIFADLPLVDTANGNAAITLATAPTFKNNNGYTRDNENVFFPMAKGTDDKKYHLSVLYAANFQELLNENDGIPYMSASNTPANVIADLYFGEGSSMAGHVISDEIINRTLNCNGINSAAFVSGNWVLWGTYAGSYDQTNATSINVFETCRMMLYYITNDFQHRHGADVDTPMSVNTLKSIVAEEQTRVDALLGINALTYGKVTLDMSADAKSDMIGGDYKIDFNVTNVPLGKSLTGCAIWTAEGFEVYFKALEDIAA